MVVAGYDGGKLHVTLSLMKVLYYRPEFSTVDGNQEAKTVLSILNNFTPIQKFPP